MFKQRKNKRFNYKPRYQNSEDLEAKANFESEWNGIKKGSTKRGRILTSLPVLIIALIALMILMYVLDGYIKS